MDRTDKMKSKSENIKPKHQWNRAIMLGLAIGLSSSIAYDSRILPEYRLSIAIAVGFFIILFGEIISYVWKINKIKQNKKN